MNLQPNIDSESNRQSSPTTDLFLSYPWIPPPQKFLDNSEIDVRDSGSWESKSLSVKMQSAGESFSLGGGNLVLRNNPRKQPTPTIPIRRSGVGTDTTVSKSWGGFQEKTKRVKEVYSTSTSPPDWISSPYGTAPIFNSTKKNFFAMGMGMAMGPGLADDLDFRPYDAINNCKSAGIIPYTIYDNMLLFLLQQSCNPIRKKDSGWNDFGGKKINPNETTAETAAREFSEETSCLFYLKEKNDPKSKEYYELLKNNENLTYDDETVKILKQLIVVSKEHYVDKITEFVLPIHISSKETYISYLVKVDYIHESDLPRAEDIHIPYETRYIRNCRWFSFNELMSLNEKDFHKRLQITRIQQRIRNYYEKGLFT